MPSWLLSAFLKETLDRLSTPASARGLSMWSSSWAASASIVVRVTILWTHAGSSDFFGGAVEATPSAGTVCCTWCSMCGMPVDLPVFVRIIVRSFIARSSASASWTSRDSCRASVPKLLASSTEALASFLPEGSSIMMTSARVMRACAWPAWSPTWSKSTCASTAYSCASRRFWHRIAACAAWKEAKPCCSLSPIHWARHLADFAAARACFLEAAKTCDGSLRRVSLPPATLICLSAWTAQTRCA
mmetsp:Transcript_63734/g.179406  ORF Transcript_63734/g.179406 Transcript_63734/m.179406 type:complete len:245 (+) Transcript_63734:168-902(+)